MDSYLFGGNGPLIGPLNNTVVGLDNPVPMDIDHICNKARFMLLLVSKPF